MRAKSWHQRLWNRLDRTSSHGCWLWTGPTNRHGYAFISICASQSSTGKPHNVGAHRLAFNLSGGVIPDGQEAMHTCDSSYPAGDPTYRRCCNPAHIRAGTHQENMREMLDKGRYTTNLGEETGNARLTTTQVQRIRARYAAKEASQRVLAREYEVTQAAISYIVTGVRWGHVEDSVQFVLRAGPK